MGTFGISIMDTPTNAFFEHLFFDTKYSYWFLGGHMKKIQKIQETNFFHFRLALQRII